MDTAQLGLPDEPTSRPKFCSDCGQPVGGGKFCAHCGHALSGAADAAEPQVALPPLVPAQPSSGPVEEQPTVVLRHPSDDGRDADFSGSEALSDDQPFDLEWQPHEDVPAFSSSSRRRPLAFAAAAGTAVVVAVAAVLIAGYVGNSGMRSALDSSTRDFNGVMTSLASAADSSAVAAAADSAKPAADRIDSTLGRLGTDSHPAHTSVVRQLEAERSILQAISQLTAIGSNPLATWGAAHDDLTVAMEAEADTRHILAKQHDGAAAALADTTATMSKVTAAVGPALVEDATDESTRLLTSLKAVANTADLRKLGDAAAAEQAAVAAAAQALPAGHGKQVLAGYATALSALAELSKLDAEHTGGWAATRAKLAQTFGQVAAAAGLTGGANVRVALDGALGSADTVVAKAAAAISDWKAKTEAAVKDRQSDTEKLQSYASFFRSQATTYGQLRQDLSTFINRVEDPNVTVTYSEGYAFLSQAAQERRDIRDMMVGMDVPAGVRSAHQEMVSAVDRAISAVQSAYDGVLQADCYYNCPYYRDTPGWQRFQSESDAISKQYATAMTAWESATAAEKIAISNRPLPAKPQV
jgi:hypothetical protein